MSNWMQNKLSSFLKISQLQSEGYVVGTKTSCITFLCLFKRASLMAQVGGETWLQCRRPRFDSWVRKIRWRRDRLPTPTLMGFPCGSARKESACRPGFNPWGGKIPWRRGRLPTHSILAWRIPWTYTAHGVAKSQTWLRLSLSPSS